MILCLDVGNSQIHGGIFKGEELLLQFRKQSKNQSSSDEYGLFLKSVLRENGIDPQEVEHISICSVVPESNHSILGACQKYFNLTPFSLKAGVKTGLKIKYSNPVEVGADRIANAVAATHLYPNTNLVIIDFGTATTFCAVTKEREYLGGCILAGMRISMEALESRTSKLPSVELKVPEFCIGRSTVESIQSGLYYGTVGAVKEVTSQFKELVFKNEPFTVIGTGGFARLLQKENLFDVEDSTLVLKGLYLANKFNSNTL